MKPQWKLLSERFTDFVENFIPYLEATDNNKTKKAVRKLEKLINEVIASHNEFSKLVDPIAPAEVKFPFESKKFAKIWKMYKDYLEESHQRFLPSRAEGMNLKFLNDISGNNETRATMILEFMIRNQYPRLFLPSEKQMTGEEPDTNQTNASAGGFDLSLKKKSI